MQLTHHQEQLAYFEDLTPDFIARADGYMMTEAEILEFGRRFDPQPFHTDASAAQDSVFGGLVAPGCLVMCARSWLVNQLDICPAYAAILGVENLDIRRPVRPGDTLRLDATVITARASHSRPDCGVVSMQNRMYNQHNELVLEMVAKMLVRRRDAVHGVV